MRHTTLVGVIAAGASALALSMVLVNFAFEAAGSVPDLEGCGFLAGSVTSLAVIYPLLSGMISARVSRGLARRGVGPDSIVRIGAATGALGSSIYFGFGTATVLRGDFGPTVSPNLWALSFAFVAACAWAARAGAAYSLAESFPFGIRRYEN